MGADRRYGLPDNGQDGDREERPGYRMRHEAGIVAIGQLQSSPEIGLRHRTEDETNNEGRGRYARLDESITENAEAEDRPDVEYAACKAERADRLRRAQAMMQREGIDALLVEPGASLIYYIGRRICLGTARRRTNSLKP